MSIAQPPTSSTTSSTMSMRLSKIICLVLLLLNHLHLACSFFPVLSSVKRSGNIPNVVSPRRNFRALQLRRKRRLRDRQTNTNDTTKKRIIPSISDENSVDAMRARAAKLRLSIVKQQLQLQELERQIICCHNSNQNLQNENNPWWMRTFSESTSVLMNKMRMSGQTVGQPIYNYLMTKMKVTMILPLLRARRVLETKQNNHFY